MLQVLLPLAWSSERATLPVLLEHGAKEGILIVCAGPSGRSRPVSHELAVVIDSAFFLASTVLIVLINVVIEAEIYKLLHGLIISFLDIGSIFTAALIEIGLLSD